MTQKRKVRADYTHVRAFDRRTLNSHERARLKRLLFGLSLSACRRLKLTLSILAPRMTRRFRLDWTNPK